MADVKQAYGAYTAMTITNLDGIASSATAGWSSAHVDNTSTLALDYEILVNLPVDATAPASDKAVYVYAYGGVEISSGVFRFDDLGTTTTNIGAEGTATIATPNNLNLIRVMPYTATGQFVTAGGFFISNAFGGRIPDAWGLLLINATGATLSNPSVVAYRAYTETVA